MFSKVKDNFYLISGKAHYAIVNQPIENRKYKSDEIEHIYRIDLILEEDEHIQLLKLHSALKVKQEFKILIDKNNKDNPDTGKPTFQFRREAVTDDKGNYIEGPVVIDSSGKPLGDVSIGNGSDVVVSFYAKSFGKEGRHRFVLNGVKVTNLVPYEAPPKEPPMKPDLDVFNTGDDKDIPF